MDGPNTRFADRRALVYKGLPPDHTCCDQALRILPKGEWIVVFMTGGTTEPELANHVRLCRSRDQGMTWGPAEVVLQYDDRACLLSEAIVDGSTVTVFVQTHRDVAKIVGSMATPGFAQGVAVLPGVSRSGVTIATAMLLGIQADASFRFSFLASLPAIVGAAVFEAAGAEGLGSLSISAWVGGVTAMVTGYLALVILRQIILVGRMWTFALYLIPLGLLLVIR